MTPQETGVMRALRDHLSDLIEDIGGCDHSVGICACDIRNSIEYADVLLGDARWCACEDEQPSCSKCEGVGIIYGLQA